ncbi:MAG: (d)CMP kinase [Spirochaetaceae bacterium]|jgi:cytidylate kinase|nr:(d)CMP kinase [Spirochaetaceae bacterium]
MVIAIDGPAGSGKSTVSEMLAENFGFTYINSGNIYRAFTLACIRGQIAVTDTEAVCAYVQTVQIDYQGNALYLNGENVTELLHTDEIDRQVSIFSSIVQLRHRVNTLIRRIAQNTNAVVEGRDITTVLFPDAEYRFYLDASLDARARRRFEQGISSESLEEIQRSLAERDSFDQKNVEGSLKIVPGVCIFDTSLLTIQEVYDTLVNKIQQKGPIYGRGGSGNG